MAHLVPVCERVGGRSGEEDVAHGAGKVAVEPEGDAVDLRDRRQREIQWDLEASQLADGHGREIECLAHGGRHDRVRGQRANHRL